MTTHDPYSVTADELRQFIELAEQEAVLEVYKAALGMS